MIAIIDYDAGNIKSVEKALVHLGEEVVITRDKQVLLSADKVILPGVGAFEDAMGKLHSYDLVDTIKQIVDKGTPFLGICLGLQLMFERSDESENDVPGLGLLPGEIVKIPPQEGLKIPHMGWNSIEVKNGSKLFEGIENNSYVYFVHSYYLKAKNEEDVVATTEYSTHIHASVEHGNIFGCQFHPEKSGEVGLKILKNFAQFGKENA
jgi:glutamine amidotransferase